MSNDERIARLLNVIEKELFKPGTDTLARKHSEFGADTIALLQVYVELLKMCEGSIA